MTPFRRQQLFRAAFFAFSLSLINGASSSVTSPAASPVSTLSLSDSAGSALSPSGSLSISLLDKDKEAACSLLALARPVRAVGTEIFCDPRIIDPLIKGLWGEATKLDSLRTLPVYGAAPFKACFAALAFALTSVKPPAQKEILEELYSAHFLITKKLLSGESGVFIAPLGVAFYYRPTAIQTMYDLVSSAKKMFYLFHPSPSQILWHRFITDRFRVANSIVYNKLCLQGWWIDAHF